MTKKYLGLREDGEWEEFYSDDPKEATPEASGYKEVVGADE